MTTTATKPKAGKKKTPRRERSESRHKNVPRAMARWEGLSLCSHCEALQHASINLEHTGSRKTACDVCDLTAALKDIAIPVLEDLASGKATSADGAEALAAISAILDAPTVPCNTPKPQHEAPHEDPENDA